MLQDSDLVIGNYFLDPQNRLVQIVDIVQGKHGVKVNYVLSEDVEVYKFTYYGNQPAHPYHNGWDIDYFKEHSITQTEYKLNQLFKSQLASILS